MSNYRGMYEKSDPLNKRLKKCPCCGSNAHIEDKQTIKKYGIDVVYGRIVCDKNIKNSKPLYRCYIKTVCGPLGETIRSWNSRVNNET
jgi:hypothetical protein